MWVLAWRSSRFCNRLHHRHRRRLEVWIVGVAVLAASPEGISIVLGERKIAAQALRQIGIRCEPTTEGNEVSIPTLENRFCPGAIETAGRDDRPLEYLPQELRGHWRLPLDQGLRAFDPRLDDVEVG
jgi:hypothetical protein